MDRPAPFSSHSPTSLFLIVAFAIAFFVTLNDLLRESSSFSLDVRLPTFQSIDIPSGTTSCS